jgi:transposase
VASLIAAGHDGRLGTLMPGAEAIHPIKLNGVDPQRYFTDLLTRLVNGWPNRRIDDLMPWCWAKSGNT